MTKTIEQRPRAAGRASEPCAVPNCPEKQAGQGITFAGHAIGYKLYECVSCGGQANHFKDRESAREYSISGLCQKCQPV